MRRTTTIDTYRPGDILGDAHQLAVGRDLVTGLDGVAVVVGEALVRTVLDYPDHYRLASIESDPRVTSLDDLLDQPVSTGFRAAMQAVVPQQHRDATLLHALLDDLPGAALVSGYAVGRFAPHRPRKPGAPVLQIEGLCAGFQRGGTIMRGIDDDGRAPLPTGPDATPLLDPSDPLAWHEMRPMGPHDMRRWRCLDVVRGDDVTAPVAVEAYLRDSHVDEAGLETVIHEYTVRATVDPATALIVDGAATAHTLPWLECIEAEASGARIGSEPLGGLRDRVRQGFVGITTCTHLNDTLRSLEDVRALLGIGLEALQ